MLTDEQITKLTNNFIRMGMKVGLQNGCGGGRQICLFRHEDGWSLELTEHTEKRVDQAVLRIDYPMVLPDDELDAAIELAGLISTRLHDWTRHSMGGRAGGKKSSATLTPEQRHKRAKKAVAARMAKYNQKSRKTL